MENIALIATALLLVVLNGFFVAAEFGLVKLRQTRVRAIARTQGWQGRILAKVHGQLDTYLSVCQLGITLASLGLGWIGAPAFAELLKPAFIWLGIQSPNLIHGISFALAFFLIALLHIVVGELAPKSMAIRRPERVGLRSAAPLYAFYWIMYPAIRVLNSSANLVLRLTGLGTMQGHDAHYSAEELKLILRTSRSRGRFSRDKWNVPAQTLDFGELEVEDLMRPIHELCALHRSRSLQENLQTIYSTRFSCYPYLDSNGVTVLGMVHLKDLFLAEHAGKEICALDEYLRPVQYVAPHMPALELLRQLRKDALHFAIVGRKDRKPLGFLTLDNLIDAFAGEVRDEFRQSDNDWTRLDDGTLIGKGSLPIFTLERMLGIDIQNQELDLEEAESVGGLIMERLGDLPREGQKIPFDQFDVVVKKMNGPRIVLVRVYPKGLEEHDPSG